VILTKCVHLLVYIVQGGSNMTRNDLMCKHIKSVPVIFEPPCNNRNYMYHHIPISRWNWINRHPTYTEANERGAPIHHISQPFSSIISADITLHMATTNTAQLQNILPFEEQILISQPPPAHTLW